MKDALIPACLIVDDFPLNASHCRRAQVEAFGYKVVSGPWARGWRSQRRAVFMPVPLLERFADLVEEFNIRGKFTVLPCPAGWGRMDRGVRNLPEPDRQAYLEIVRKRIAPRFNVTPEVLTHTLALDLDSGALLPHNETPWLTHLAGEKRLDELCAYLRRAWEILVNVGFQPVGTTIGGMEDPSGIGGGQSLNSGDHLGVLGEALLRVQEEFAPAAPVMFMFTGSPPVRSESKATLAPEEVHSTSGRAVYQVHACGDDPLLDVFNGHGDPAREAAKLVAPNLKSGSFIEHIETGRALVVGVHSQTLDSMHTGRGLQVLREVVKRLHARYGKRLSWMTPLELIARMGVPRPAASSRKE
jgi:hypothetical protein